jgi:hypothetical protein
MVLATKRLPLPSRRNGDVASALWLARGEGEGADLAGEALPVLLGEEAPGPWLPTPIMTAAAEA